MSLNIIKEMKLNDQAGTAFDVSALSNAALKKISVIDTDITPPAPNPTPEEGNNLIIGENTAAAAGSYPLKNTDIKAVKSIRFFPGTKETKFLADCDSETSATKKFNQIHIKTCVDSDIAWAHGKTTPGTKPSSFKDPVIRARLSCSELELNSKNAYTRNDDGSFSQTEIDHLDIVTKSDNKYVDGKIKARSIDIRANATTAEIGKGGGIAVQIASCDDNRNENKFKIETSRKKAPSEGLMPSGGTYSEWYTTEGGKGIEIGTINSQFESFGCKEIRRMADSSVFAVTRSAVRGWKSDGTECDPTSEDAVKWDYITQSDDTKDIKSSSQPTVKWVDLINAAIYLKAKGNIPSDGSFIPSVNVTYALTNVTATNPKSVALKSEEFTQVLTATSGTISAPTVTVGGVSVASTWESSTNTLKISQAVITGDIVITATAA